MAKGIFTAVIQKLERAARNGERLHLTIDEVRAVYASEAGRWLVLAARDELVAEYATPVRPLPASPPVPDLATSRELTPEQDEMVADAGRRQCVETIARLTKCRRRRPKQK